jgi:hypothetical protein
VVGLSVADAPSGFAFSLRQPENSRQRAVTASTTVSKRIIFFIACISLSVFRAWYHTQGNNRHAIISLNGYDFMGAFAYPRRANPPGLI